MPTPSITPTTPTPTVAGNTAASAGGRTGTSRFDTVWAGRSPAASADSVWVPTVSATLVLVVGVISIATRQPWLSVGLGPTALLIASNPASSTTRFHSVVVGHVVAFLCAWFALLLLGVGDAVALTGSGSRAIPVERIWASAIAVALTALVQPSLRAYHPPAAATALLVTLGIYKLTWKTSLSMLAGVVVVALLGEWFRRIRLRERPARSSKA